MIQPSTNTIPFFVSIFSKDSLKKYSITLPKTNMTIEHPPFEDVFPIENGDFSNVTLVFRGVRDVFFNHFLGFAL